MKLSTYIKGLNEALKKHGDLDVVYAKDSEGNGYAKVFYLPSAGKFENNQFENEDIKNPNAICIN